MRQKLRNTIANHRAKVGKIRPGPLGENYNFMSCLVYRTLDSKSSFLEIIIFFTNIHLS